MKTTYILGIDTAKRKIRAALRGAHERFLFEKDLPVSVAGLRELLARLKAQTRRGNLAHRLLPSGFQRRTT